MEKGMKEMKENLNDIQMKIDKIDSRQASTGMMVRMNLKNMNIIAKKTNEDVQKVKKQTETNQVILADNRQKLNIMNQQMSETNNQIEKLNQIYLSMTTTLQSTQHSVFNLEFNLNKLGKENEKLINDLKKLDGRTNQCCAN
jgi:chromosome segregation ATPase